GGWGGREGGGQAGGRHGCAACPGAGRPARVCVRPSPGAGGGDISGAVGGPPVFPPLPKEVLSSVSFGVWRPQADDETTWRRSVYVYRRRGLVYPLFQVFDLPEQNVTAASPNDSRQPKHEPTLPYLPFVHRQGHVLPGALR